MNIYQMSRLLSLRRELRAHERWNRTQLDLYKAEALRDLRDYAYANSPFYRRFHGGMVNSPLGELPVLTKAELMKNWDELVTDRTVRLSEVQDFLKNLNRGNPLSLYKNRYYTVSTAGSTGLKGIFLYNSAECLMVLASYLRASDWAGIRTGLTRRLRMAMVSTTAPWHQSALVGATLNRWLEPTLRVDSTEPVAEIIAKLNAYQPRCLIAYANTARLLAQEQLSGSLKISPEAVFSVSEVLTKDSRNLIDKAWYARSFNIYGATETAGIASECSERQKLHIYEDLVIIEVVDENNKPVEPGEYGAKLLVTVLFSRTLPLIRYEISDSVRLSADSCHCRRPFALMTDIQGRAEDVIDLSGESGSIVSVQPNLFHDIMEMFPVGGWQVTQEQSNALKISILNPAPAFREDNLRELISTKLFKLGAVPTSVKVEYVTSLPKGALGKTYLVKSLKGASQTRTQ